MQETVDKNEVITYYNEHTKNKLNDYIKVNVRIEEAWSTLTRFSPAKPKRILEIGCGVGSISKRMNRKWPEAKVTGMDISTHSIDLAKALFENKNLNFAQGILLQDTFDEEFDLIVFMDVYEHIAVEDRPEVHKALRKTLKNKGRIFLSVPTPHNLKWSDKHKPETMQPVDEHISFDVIGELAKATDTEVILYEIKNIWNVGDYAHIVLEKNDDFEAAFFYPKPVTTTQRLKRIFNKVTWSLGSIFRKIYVKTKIR